MPERWSEVALVVRYAGVGMLNSAVGWTLILALDLGGVLAPALANAAGFAAGVAMSFVLHRRIFAAAHTRSETLRYGAAVTLAFGANQGVLAFARSGLGPTPLDRAIGQACAILVYSAALFLLCRFWVFARDRDDDAFGGGPPPERGAKAALGVFDDRETISRGSSRRGARDRAPSSPRPR